MSSLALRTRCDTPRRRRCIGISATTHSTPRAFLRACASLLLLWTQLPNLAHAQQGEGDLSSQLERDWTSQLELAPPCSLDSLALSKLGADDPLEPCLLYDVRDDMYVESETDGGGGASSASSLGNNNTVEVALVQATPSMCNNHRDGAVTAVKLLNAANAGRGTALGYSSDHYVKFRLLSFVGGNSLQSGNDAYSETHVALLDLVFAAVPEAQYILGSCSFASAADKPVALSRQKVVLSQVGPPGFYRDVANNPYVFGIHVNSDTYPLPALRALRFHLNAVGVPTSKQSVRVLYRTKSEFFYSTCRSAIDAANADGFRVDEIEYDPEADHDGNGVANSNDVPFLEGLADLFCPTLTEEESASEDELPPALFACVLGGEADAILAKIRSNGCRPSMAWFTTSTWGWATDNMDTVPYMQGGGQWHENFAYGDDFFNSGQEVLDHGLTEYGYRGSYDHVVSYAMPTLIAKLLVSFFRIDDSPDIAGTLTDGYEELRRALVNFNAETIFGPVSFNEFQRNNGRGAAGMMWIPSSTVGVSSAVSEANADEDGDAGTDAGIDDADEEFILACMSPLDQADAAIIVPSPSGSKCSGGSFTNITLVETEPALLGDKCSACPVDTYISMESSYTECIPCPQGSTTLGETGQTFCTQINANLLSTGLKVMGSLFVFISWCIAIGYLTWTYRFRAVNVVKWSQPEFLILICVGAIISTSAIIPLTLADADVGEDTSSASRACQAVPFLYSLGWVLMYGSLTAKSFRLWKMARAAKAMRRVKVTAKDMYKIVAAFLALDLVVLITWQAVSPLRYVRSVTGKSIDEETGVVTIDTVGQCSGGSNMFAFLGPIIAIHVSIIVITNVWLWKIRNMSDRLQEQKVVAIASIYICELLVLGVPILAAVQDSAAARYIVVAGVIFLCDTGTLSLIFIPKIRFKAEGLPSNFSVAQSLSVNPNRNSEMARLSLSEGPLRGSGSRLASNVSTDTNGSAKGRTGGMRRKNDSWRKSDNSIPNMVSRDSAVSDIEAAAADEGSTSKAPRVVQSRRVSWSGGCKAPALEPIIGSKSEVEDVTTNEE